MDEAHTNSCVNSLLFAFVACESQSGILRALHQVYSNVKNILVAAVVNVEPFILPI